MASISFAIAAATVPGQDITHTPPTKGTLAVDAANRLEIRFLQGKYPDKSALLVELDQLVHFVKNTDVWLVV